MKNSFQKLLWDMAGAETPILEKCGTDHKKFSAIGATILMTAFIALCAGTAAAWYFTQKGDEDSGKIGWSLAFGIIWATLIFCIDRSLVITLKKDPSKKYQRFIVPFLSRALLAVVVAFMISIPLELVIFESYIRANETNFEVTQVDKLSDMIKDTNGENSLTGRITRAENNLGELRKDIDTLQKEIESLQNQINGLKKEKEHPNSKEYKDAQSQYDKAMQNYNNAQKQYNTEKNKNNSTSLNTYEQRMRNAKATLNSAKLKRYNTIQQWREDKQSEIDKQTTLLNEKKEKMTLKEKEYQNTQDERSKDVSMLQEKEGDRKKLEERKQGDLANGNHFIRNFQILEYAVWQKDENGNLTETTQLMFLWLIRLLFFIIEILPTVVKIVSPIGSYERMVYAEEEEMKKYLTSSEYSERIHKLHDIELSAKEEQLKNQHDIEIKLKEEIMKKAKKAQLEVSDAAITHWREIELKKIMNDRLYKD